MTKTLTVICGLLLLTTNKSYGFGKKMTLASEVKGVTETQVSLNDDKASVLVRGKGAELLFRAIHEKQEEQADSSALQLLGDKGKAQWTVKGKQITCSKITGEKGDDYACAFDLDKQGTLTASAEAFDPASFNLARTETGSKLFRKVGRSVASVTPAASFSRGAAYVVYSKPGQARSAENAMIVIRGDSAKGILDLIENSKEAHWGEAAGRKGQDIACVGATEKEPERCAVVLAFKDGSTTHSGNPLFR